MRVWVTSIAAAIFLSVACTAGAFTPSAGSPLANKEHPRLWITRANVADLRAKLSGDFRSEYQTFVRDLDSRMGAAKNWSDWAEDVANYAFVYQVGTVSGITYGNPLSAYGDRAKTMLLAGVADSAYAGNKNFGLAYDWVYDRLSAGERSTVVNYFKGISDGVSGGGNPYNGNDVLSRSEHILAGLAFFGDGIDDAAADAMVSKYPTLIEGPAGVLGAGSFWSGTDGGWSMGFKYAVNSSTGNATPRLMEAWRTANGLSRAAVFNAPNANVLRYFAQWVAYSIMPSSASCASCPGGYSFPLYKTHYMDAGTTAVNGLGSRFL